MAIKSPPGWRGAKICNGHLDTLKIKHDCGFIDDIEAIS